MPVSPKAAPAFYLPPAVFDYLTNDLYFAQTNALIG